MFEKFKKFGERLGVVKKREKEPLMPMFYSYVHYGSLKLGELLKRVDIEDIAEFAQLVEGLRRMIDESKLQGGAYFRANQLINLVEKENLEAEIRKAKGEHHIGSVE